jgi:hypothetical protein
MDAERKGKLGKVKGEHSENAEALNARERWG